MKRPAPTFLAPALAVLMGLASPCTLADRPSHDEARHHDDDRQTKGGTTTTRT